MPSIDNNDNEFSIIESDNHHTFPSSVEDFMPASAFSVSPILTSFIFDDFLVDRGTETDREDEAFSLDDQQPAFSRDIERLSIRQRQQERLQTYLQRRQQQLQRQERGDDDIDMLEAYSQQPSGRFTASAHDAYLQVPAPTTVAPPALRRLNEMRTNITLHLQEQQQQEVRQRRQQREEREDSISRNHSSGSSSHSSITTPIAHEFLRNHPPPQHPPPLATINTNALPASSVTTVHRGTQWLTTTSNIQHCLDMNKAFDMEAILKEESYRIQPVKVLKFDVLQDDGGQYGAMYGIENIFVNDETVYCSGRKGPVNILIRYNSSRRNRLGQNIADTACSIAKIVIISPRYGFTAPCKEGMIFISNKPINVSDTTRFDSFTKADYDQYITERLKQNNGVLSDLDPAAWFSLTNGDRSNVLDLDFRSCKYILVKMLRSHFDSDNIDLQYIGFIGHTGTASFAHQRLR